MVFTLFIPSPAFLGEFWSYDNDNRHFTLPPSPPFSPAPPPTFHDLKKFKYKNSKYLDFWIFFKRVLTVCSS